MEELNQQLYDKMVAEQEVYRDWLRELTPEEIMHHAYEYIIREDFLLAYEYSDLTARQARALLKSPTPLDDLYHKYESWDGHHMSRMVECMQSRADDVLRREFKERRNEAR